MRAVRIRPGRTLIHVAWGLIIFLPFFAPLPFYYTLHFGVFFPWLTIGGEESLPGDFKWGDYDLHFYPRAFVTDLALWLVGLLLASRFVRYIESESFVRQ